MSEIEFITAEVCPYAQRTHLALREKGLAYKHTEVDLSNKPAWFEKVSPYSKVPVLKIGDQVIYESAIINEYIEEAYPEPALMPSDPVRRAQARAWIDFCNTRLVGAFYAVLSAKDAAARTEAGDTLTGHFRTMEDGMTRLGADPYWLGDTVSLVDVAYYPFFERLGALTHYRGIDVPDDCPRLAAWQAAMRERPSVKATEHGLDYYIDSYKRYADAA